MAGPITILVSLFLVPFSSAAVTQDRTITKVVKLLERMLEKSKLEGDTERTLYGKYKCYCDTNEAEKKEAIQTGTEEISLLENQIEDLQSQTAELSTEVAQLKADEEAATEALKKAKEIRKKEKEAFDLLEKDLTTSILMMKKAIKTLADVGSDQTLAVAADHQKYMADYKMKGLQKNLRTAMLAAASVVTEKQNKVLQSFIQSPFTGTYTAQSGEVVGILKDMRDTFESNLDSARATEKTAVEAYGKYKEAKEKEIADIKKSHKTKQEQLSTNDGELATKTSQLTAAQKKLAEDQDFLSQLLEMCSAKAKQYEERTLLRTNEETAISEAIAILNSDAAFATFGTVKATKTGATGASFLQYGRNNKHGSELQDETREKARVFLRKAMAGKRLPLLSRAMALLATSNPFAVVLKEIQNMLTLIADEEKADDEQFKWCKDERKTNNDNLKKKKGEIISLEQSIDKLTTLIEAPKTGLKFQISETETSLTTNSENQKTETADRTEDNLAYQQNIANLVEAQRILTKAVTVLQKYYSKILKEEEADKEEKGKDASFVALSHSKQPAPPKTWEDDYAGQKKEGGTDAIGMIKFIMENTAKEEATAHEDEKSSQHDFEDSMQKLKKEESTLLGTLKQLKLDLAIAEEKLLGKEKDLEATVKDKEAIEAYLARIKDGCDFIEDNIAERKSSRQNEATALNKTIKLLKGNPAYLAAEEEAHQKSLGDCAEICNEKTEASAECKACLAKVTVPAYCAGHPDVAGCGS